MIKHATPDLPPPETRAEIERLRSMRDELRAEIDRLQAALRMPLSSAEVKLIDKHCDWIAFGHAWNAIMKRRRATLARKEGT